MTTDEYLDQDGITHINIHRLARTELGRQLAHGYTGRFVHPALGPFNSMEGFWRFIQSGGTDDRWRYLSGAMAMKVPKEPEFHRIPGFWAAIEEAAYWKIVQVPGLREKLLNYGDIPFDQYWIFSPEPTKNDSSLNVIVRLKLHRPICRTYDRVRNLIVNDKTPTAVDYSKILVPD